MELANREGKGGRKITFDCGRAGFYGVSGCTGTVRGTVLVGHWHQMTPNPKPQDHHRVNVDSSTVLQAIDSFCAQQRADQGP